MSTEIRAYGVAGPESAVAPLAIERRDLRPADVAIRITHCGICAEHSIHPEVEVIHPDQINEAWQRMERGDVRYRFVIDMQGNQ